MRRAGKTAAVLCALSAAMVWSAGVRFDRAQAEAIPIDMYLIGGQSNAAGYSSTDGIEGTFENVMYAGSTDKQRGTGIASSSYLSYPFVDAVTTGLGKDGEHMGPEFGMAEVLNDSYSDGHKAIIFKSAAGDTSLLNATTGGNQSYGNWYPRSLWADGFTPDPVYSPTGVQYREFVENFRSVYTQLVNNGYEPKVKAMVWMQGEFDLWEPETYKNTLEVFISDLRTDLAEITGDTDCLLMPFVIGEIATTFYQYNHPAVPAFNAMQRQVAEEVPAVFTVPTADLVIVGPNGIEGTDEAHFSGEDCEELGKRFGEQVKEALSGDKYATVQTDGNGEAAAEFNIGQSELTVTVKPDEKYKLSSLLINGEEYASEVKDGVLKIPASENVYVISAEFVKKKALRVSVEYDRTGGKAEVHTPVYEGDRLIVTVTPSPGYVVESVMFEGTALVFDEKSGCYEGQEIYNDGSLSVTFARENPPAGDGGCGSSACAAIGLPILGGVLLAGIGKKRK